MAAGGWRGRGGGGGLGLQPEIVVSRTKRGTTFLSQVSSRVGQTRMTISHGVFFLDFFRDVSRETIGFESISGKHSSKSGLKTCGFVRGIPKKVKTKHCARAISFAQVPRLAVKSIHLEFNATFQRIHRIRCHSLWLGTSLHTRRGSG